MSLPVTVANELTAELSSPKLLRSRACCFLKPLWFPSSDWALLLEEPEVAAVPVLDLDCCLFFGRLLPAEPCLLAAKSPPNLAGSSFSFGQATSKAIQLPCLILRSENVVILFEKLTTKDFLELERTVGVFAVDAAEKRIVVLERWFVILPVLW